MAPNFFFDPNQNSLPKFRGYLCLAFLSLGMMRLMSFKMLNVLTPRAPEIVCREVDALWLMRAILTAVQRVHRHKLCGGHSGPVSECIGKDTSPLPCGDTMRACERACVVHMQ